MNFYVLANPTRQRTDAITDFLTQGTTRGEAPRCRACGKPVGMLPALPPIKVELTLWGNRFGDVAFGPGNEVLVSERFKDGFSAARLIGFPDFIPVEVTRITFRGERVSDPITKYFAARPALSRTAIDEKASGLDRDALWTCEECRIANFRRFRRIVIESGTWTGEDVFFARGLPGTIIASERFKQFCDKHAFANCLLIEADRYGVDSFPDDKAPRPRPSNTV
jgi:hypothetical protein